MFPQHNAGIVRNIRASGLQISASTATEHAPEQNFCRVNKSAHCTI
jgi:hypothetical protein